jgi:hypothetical protein
MTPDDSLDLDGLAGVGVRDRSNAGFRLAGVTGT